MGKTARVGGVDGGRVSKFFVDKKTAGRRIKKIKGKKSNQ